MKISKFYLVPVILIMVIALTGCGRKSAEVGDDSSSRSESRILDEKNYSSISASEILEKGESLECYVEIKEDDGSYVEAIYYFDGKNERIRVEMDVSSPYVEKTFKSTVIVKDGWNYFWDDFMNIEGMKIKSLDEDDPLNEEITSDIDEEYNFNCKPWRVDKSMFDLPKDKTFEDMASFYESFDMGDFDMESYDLGDFDF